MDAIAETKSAQRPYAQADSFRSKHVMDAVATGDGLIFYELTETVGSPADASERRRTTLWRLDLSSGAARELTDWAFNATAPALCADGSALFFLASTAAQAPSQVHRLDVATGAYEAVTSVAAGVTTFAVAPDGDSIAYASFDPAALAGAAEPHVRISTLVYRFDSVPGYLQHMRQILFLMSLDGSADTHPVAAIDGIVSAVRWAPQGDRFAYVVSFDSSTPPWFGTADLYVASAAEAPRRLLAGQSIISVLWSQDGQTILFAGAPDGDFTLQSKLFALDPDSGDLANLTADHDRPLFPIIQANNPTFMAFGRLVPFGSDGMISSIGEAGQSWIGRVALDGSNDVEPILTGPFLARPLALVAGALLYMKQGFLEANALWLRDLESGEDRQLTDHNAALVSQIAWPTVERVTTRSGGVEVEGWLMKPVDAIAPYPTIVAIRGGPHGAAGHGYCEDFLELTGAGYAVFLVNPRGSTTYGKAFAEAIIGAWGDPEREDIDALLDLLVANGTIDPQRLGITGFSGGGHLTAWLMTHSDRYTAAVPHGGVYNMFSMYGTSDVGLSLIRKQMGAAPHERPDFYWERSPVAHAHKCRTPSLLIHGEKDVRCPIEQAEQLYTILKHSGCEVEFLRLRDCNHGAEVMDVPSLRRARMDATRDWFDRYLMADAG